MNIHVSKILSKMQDEIEKAKTSTSEHQIKEHILIIQSLCDLIVDHKTQAQSVQSSSQIVSPTSSQINPAELQKMMGNIPTVSKQKPESSPYKEEGANGDSLFDF